jgi:hypothetical protein
MNSVHSNAARISVGDVNRLNDASEALFAVAEMIKRVNPPWKDGAINLLIRANEQIVRVQQKGARAFQRYYAKQVAKDGGQGAIEDASAAAEPASCETEPGEN